MPSLNLCVFCGNLVRDPELRHAPSGTEVCNFTIAVNEIRGKDADRKEETLFMRCVAFKSTATVITSHCKKGDQVLVTGRLQERSWEDRESGATKKSIELLVDRFQFIPRWEWSRQSSKPDDDSSASF